MPVDHDSSVPPSRQIAAELRARILSGNLPPGGRVPSISTLMQENGVARNTASRALQALEEEGLVTIVHGWGTFVVDELPKPEG